MVNPDDTAGSSLETSPGGNRSTASPLPASGAADRLRPGLPAPLPGSGALNRLAAGVCAYAAGALSDNTARAYAADWAQYALWCRRHGAAPLPPAPQVIGLYLTDLTDLATPQRRRSGHSVASIERRLYDVAWTCAQAGHRLDRQDRHVAAVLAGIRRRHARPPVRKDALSPDDIRAMLATLPRDLRGLRDRAMLLLGFGGRLRRSEITGLDRTRDDLDAGGADGAGAGWVEIFPEGLLLTLRGKTGWRAVEIGRGSAPATCPVFLDTDPES